MARVKINAMHDVYGKMPGKCAGCSNLFYERKTGTGCKCRVYGISSGEATDWREFYPACGMYGQKAPTGQQTLYERLSKKERMDDRAAIDGQISIFG